MTLTERLGRFSLAALAGMSTLAGACQAAQPQNSPTIINHPSFSRPLTNGGLLKTEVPGYQSVLTSSGYRQLADDFRDVAELAGKKLKEQTTTNQPQNMIAWGGIAEVFVAMRGQSYDQALVNWDSQRASIFDYNQQLGTRRMTPEEREAAKLPYPTIYDVEGMPNSLTALQGWAGDVIGTDTVAGAALMSYTKNVAELFKNLAERHADLIPDAVGEFDNPVDREARNRSNAAQANFKMGRIHFGNGGAADVPVLNNNVTLDYWAYANQQSLRDLEALKAAIEIADTTGAARQIEMSDTRWNGLVTEFNDPNWRNRELTPHRALVYTMIASQLVQSHPMEARQTDPYAKQLSNELQRMSLYAKVSLAQITNDIENCGISRTTPIVGRTLESCQPYASWQNVPITPPPASIRFGQYRRMPVGPTPPHPVPPAQPIGQP